MSVQTIIEKIAVNVKLNNGTTKTGAVRTATVSLGTLNKEAFDAEKALAIAGLITPCLTKSVYELQKVETSRLTN